MKKPKETRFVELDTQADDIIFMDESGWAETFVVAKPSLRPIKLAIEHGEILNKEKLREIYAFCANSTGLAVMVGEINKETYELEKYDFVQIANVKDDTVVDFIIKNSEDKKSKKYIVDMNPHIKPNDPEVMTRIKFYDNSGKNGKWNLLKRVDFIDETLIFVAEY